MKKITLFGLLVVFSFSVHGVSVPDSPDENERRNTEAGLAGDHCNCNKSPDGKITDTPRYKQIAEVEGLAAVSGKGKSPVPGKSDAKQ